MSIEAALLEPSHLLALGRTTPVPKATGAYAWYFDEPPPGVSTTGTHLRHGHFLLYVGIAPRKPPGEGKPSVCTLRDRLRQHYALNAYGSTLRMTLGCLLGLELRRMESTERPGYGKRTTFGSDEERLSAWMEEHARVVWVKHDEPWQIEADRAPQCAPQSERLDSYARDLLQI